MVVQELHGISELVSCDHVGDNICFWNIAYLHNGLIAQFDDSVSKIPPYSLRSNNKALRIRYGVIANDSVFVTEQL